MTYLLSPGVVLACGLAAQASDQGPVTTSITQDALPAQVVPRSAPSKADHIVVYSATWCGPCQRLKPILQSLKREGYEVECLDVDRDSAQLEYDYRTVPTIYFVRGESVIKRKAGYCSKEHIKRTLALRPSPPPVPVSPGVY